MRRHQGDTSPHPHLLQMGGGEKMVGLSSTLVLLRSTGKPLAASSGQRAEAGTGQGQRRSGRPCWGHAKGRGRRGRALEAWAHRVRPSRQAPREHNLSPEGPGAGRATPGERSKELGAGAARVYSCQIQSVN